MEIAASLERNEAIERQVIRNTTVRQNTGQKKEEYPEYHEALPQEDDVVNAASAVVDSGISQPLEQPPPTMAVTTVKVVNSGISQPLEQPPPTMAATTVKVVNSGLSKTLEKPPTMGASLQLEFSPPRPRPARYDLKMFRYHPLKNVK